MGLSATKEPPIAPDAEAPITTDKTNTLADVYDPTDVEFSPWFSTTKGVSEVASGNEVIPYIRGKKLFSDMVAAIRTATGPGHFIYLLGWNCNVNFELVDGDPTTTLTELLTVADASKVDVRAMLYKHVPTFTSVTNVPAVTFIEGLKHGSAIHDERVMELGSLATALVSVFGMGNKVGAHHQKILVVRGNAGLIAFQGGYDIDPNRLRFNGGPGLHDVHTRIMGTCAWFLYDIFVKRWNDHPDSKTKKPINKAVPVPAPHPDNLFVQIAHTFPNAASNSGVAPSGYAFAPAGDQSAKKMLLNAIARAREFIYVEDQYLVDMAISDALKAAIPNIKLLIILVEETIGVNDEIKQATARRKAFITNLGAHPKKLAVCQLRAPRYVHSKTWIFDDKFAVVGSANVNRRGFTHDSEQTAGIFDTNPKKRFFFAHELRMNLWAKHLKQKPIDLHDPIASATHWFPPTGHVVPFDDTTADSTGFEASAVAWDVAIDPDGS